jgi:histidyl-tRNA synthetase
MISTQPARGMRDFLPDEVRRRQYVIDVVTGVYSKYGFEPLETPAVENIETLTGKYGEEGNKLIFKILRRGEGESSGEADLALRYDLTVPLARVVAEYRAQLPRVFKRYQIQPVWRADRPARGRFREFYQCDVDVVGSRSVVVEAELCAAASDVLLQLGFRDFHIRLNHRAVLMGVLDAAGIPGELHGAALVALDKLDKVGAEGVRRELLERGVSEAGARATLAFFDHQDAHAAEAGGWNSGWLDRLRSVAGGDRPGEPHVPASADVSTRFIAAIDELAAILSLAADTSAGPHLRIEPSLARGLSYYTGAIMEVAVADLPGSLGGGGRYDNLIGMFLREDVPACGFSLGLERILVVMSERKMFPPGVAGAPADVLVTQWNAERAGDALALAATLRSAGLRVDVYPDADKLGKQFKYAASRGIANVLVVGDDELAASEVTIKDMKTGDQRRVPRNDVATALSTTGSAGLPAGGSRIQNG